MDGSATDATPAQPDEAHHDDAQVGEEAAAEAAAVAEADRLVRLRWSLRKTEFVMIAEYVR